MDRWNKTHCDRCKKKVENGEGIYAIGGFFHKMPCYEEEKQRYIDSYEWDEYKTSFESEMICPYCGYVNRDSWEYDDDGIRKCGRCEKEFEYVRNVEVTYSTNPIEGD